MKEENLNAIGLVTKKTGLSSHVIRVWEKRYGAIKPVRSDGNQRLYSDKDVSRLMLLKRAIEGGRSIGRIASLEEADLRELIRQDMRPADDLEADADESAATDAHPNEIMAACLAAVEMLDRERLRTELIRASAALGHRGFVDTFASNFMTQVGDRWMEGTFRIFHEHFSSAVVRDVLGELLKRFEKQDSSRLIVAATPPGQLHELGALMSSVVAAMEGYAVNYLGANTPLVEIARAAELQHADIILLSIIYPPEDEILASELADFMSILPSQTQVYIGGGGKGWYANRITLPRLSFIDDLETLRDKLLLTTRPA